jgi:hypothetical protein
MYLGAPHVKRAVCEIDDGEHAEDERQADRQQHIERPQRDAGEQLQPQALHVNPAMKAPAASASNESPPARGSLVAKLLAATQVGRFGRVGAGDFEHVGIARWRA